MSKRFYDTEMFKKTWFRKLETKLKSFWWYALCNCDIAGIIELDLEAACFFVGEDISLEEIETSFSEQIVKVADKKYFIRDFVIFQNGEKLNSKSPIHAKIISILEKYRLWDRVSNRVCNTPIYIEGVIEGVVVKEIVGEEVIVKPPEEKKEQPILYPFDSLNFKTIWTGWKVYLKELGKPYHTFSSEQAALQFLSKYSEEIAIEIISKSIKNQWKNLREPDEQSNNKNQRKADIGRLNEITSTILRAPLTFIDNPGSNS